MRPVRYLLAFVLLVAVDAVLWSSYLGFFLFGGREYQGAWTP